jgi:hypothetical protein
MCKHKNVFKLCIYRLRTRYHELEIYFITYNNITILLSVTILLLRLSKHCSVLWSMILLCTMTYLFCIYTVVVNCMLCIVNYIKKKMFELKKKVVITYF